MMIRRATGRIDSFTKESGEVVENKKTASEEVLDELELQELSKNSKETEAKQD